jgi:foldase protein PrsA
MNAARTALSACALIAAAATMSACGGVPGNAVAEVDGTPIERDSFEHWMEIAAKAGGQPGGAVPDAPGFTQCVANKRRTTPKPAKGQPKTSDSQLKEQCKQEYEALRDQVLQQLLSYEWVRGQAEEMGIEVSDDEVRKSYDEQRKQSFPKDADFRKFLRDSGQSEQDLLLQVRLDLLADKITQKVIEGKDRVTDAQIEKFYEENRERFAQPERRDLRIVLTRSKAQANEAKAALESGDSWKAVATEFSIDEASKSQGGKLPAQAEGTLEKRLDEAVFKARKGEISGPVRTQFGHYVFTVEKVQKASQQTLEQARETIRQTVQSQNQQKALDDFRADYQAKWRERTECRDGYVTQSCSNGPRPTPTPTPVAPG